MESYSELALRSIDKDVRYLAWKWYIPNYTKEEIEQELRLRVWEKIPLYSVESGVSFRTWANMLMRNRLKNLLRDQTNQFRGEGVQLLPLLSDNNSEWKEVPRENPLAIEHVMIIIDAGKNIEDYFL